MVSGEALCVVPGVQKLRVRGEREEVESADIEEGEEVTYTYTVHT